MATETETPALLEEKITLRGVEYTVTELSIRDYDQIVKDATVKRRIENDDGDGTSVEEVDATLQSRLMVLKAVTPKVDAMTAGTRLFGALNRTVNRMHFDVDEELDNAKKNGTSKAKTEKGTDSGNG